MLGLPGWSKWSWWSVQDCSWLVPSQHWMTGKVTGAPKNWGWHEKPHGFLWISVIFPSLLFGGEEGCLSFRWPRSTSLCWLGRCLECQRRNGGDGHPVGKNGKMVVDTGMDVHYGLDSSFPLLVVCSWFILSIKICWKMLKSDFDWANPSGNFSVMALQAIGHSIFSSQVCRALDRAS